MMGQCKWYVVWYDDAWICDLYPDISHYFHKFLFRFWWEFFHVAFVGIFSPDWQIIFTLNFYIDCFLHHLMVQVTETCKKEHKHKRIALLFFQCFIVFLITYTKLHQVFFIHEEFLFLIHIRTQLQKQSNPQSPTIFSSFNQHCENLEGKI